MPKTTRQLQLLTRGTLEEARRNARELTGQRARAGPAWPWARYTQGAGLAVLDLCDALKMLHERVERLEQRAAE